VNTGSTHTNIASYDAVMSRPLAPHGFCKIEGILLHIVQDSFTAYSATLLQAGKADTIFVVQGIVQQLKQIRCGLEADKQV